MQPREEAQVDETADPGRDGGDEGDTEVRRSLESLREADQRERRESAAELERHDRLEDRSADDHEQAGKHRSGEDRRRDQVHVHSGSSDDLWVTRSWSSASPRSTSTFTTYAFGLYVAVAVRTARRKLELASASRSGRVTKRPRTGRRRTSVRTSATTRMPKSTNT